MDIGILPEFRNPTPWAIPIEQVYGKGSKKQSWPSAWALSLRSVAERITCKHHAQLDRFVRAANLGWEEIREHNDFPALEELDPHDKHPELLARIDRAFDPTLRKSSCLLETRRERKS